MSEYKYCKECKTFHYSNEPCSPAYRVFHEDYLNEDGKIIHGVNHHDAAMKYAEEYNSNGDYLLMNESVNITVEKDGVSIKFKISACQSVDYGAQQVD